MLTATINYDEALVSAEDEVNGSKEFGFWECIRGLLVGGRDFANEVEEALRSAEKEF